MTEKNWRLINTNYNNAYLNMAIDEALLISEKPVLRLYRWKPAADAIEKSAESIRLFDELSLHTGLTIDEMRKELYTKQNILEWMVQNNIREVESVGKIMAKYYVEPEEVEKAISKNKVPEWFG